MSDRFQLSLYNLLNDIMYERNIHIHSKPFPSDNYIFVLPLCWSSEGGETNGQAEHGNGENSCDSGAGARQPSPACHKTHS